jgi:small subunit ribosomal protein S20
MPTTKQAKKRMRQTERRNEHNRSVRSDLRTHIKRYKVAVNKGEENVGELLAKVESKIDKAAKRNIIPTSRANRIKSRLKKLGAAKA